MDFQSFKERVLAFDFDETDPHESCQECYFNYPYVLQRVLLQQTTVHVATDKLGIFSNMEYADFFGSSGSRPSEELPSPSDTERSWRDALILAKLPPSDPVDGQERPFPSLRYLAKLTLWENMRSFDDVDAKIANLPTNEDLKKNLTQFIKREEKCIKRHVCGKLSKLLMSGDFLNTL